MVLEIVSIFETISFIKFQLPFIAVKPIISSGGEIDEK